jgi:hypothetical protein
MAAKKRFTDANKWNKVWYRKLKPVEKCFWTYLCDTCDNAGIWEVDFEMAGILIGEPLDPAKLKETFARHFTEIHKGTKWHLIDFVPFQCGCEITQLNETVKPHLSIIRILKQERVLEQFAYPLVTVPSKCYVTLQDKDKEKDIDKDKDKEKEVDEEYILVER